MKGAAAIESLIVGAFAFAVFVFTAGSGVFPGDSAFYVAGATGLVPRYAPSDSIWYFLAHLVAATPFGSVASRLNLLSAVCGAVSAGLLYWVVGRTIGMILSDGASEAKRLLAARIAGLLSALALTFSIPFWFVASRAHAYSFDILLVLFLSWLFLQYVIKGKQWLAILFAFAYGLAIVEWSTFIVLAPLFGLALLFVYWKNENLTFWPVAKLVIAGVAGLGLYFLVAWAFYDTPGYHARGYAGYWQVLWYMWRDQYYEITRSLPTHGWLLVLVTSIIPFLIVLMLGKRSLTGESDLHTVILHAVLTIACVTVLADLKIAPWRIIGQSRVLVTPYLLNAIVFGYLAIYWWLLFAAQRRLTVMDTGTKGGQIVGACFVVLAGGFAVSLPFMHFDQVDARPLKPLDMVARQIVKDMGDREWLVTDGVIDNMVIAAAHDKGKKIKVINLSGAGGEIYQRYIATLFTDPRLKNLAAIGVRQLVQEWFARDPEIASKVAVYWTPNVVLAGGYVVAPAATVCLPVKAKGDIEGRTAFASAEPFWRRLIAVSKESGTENNILKAYRQHILSRVSLAANNMGVYLEDLGQKDDAFASYDYAVQINPQNLSALLNISVMLNTGYRSDKYKDLLDRVKAIASKTDPRVIWTLSDVCGFVRLPEAFTRSGLYWAVSGQAKLAESSFKRAVELSSPENVGVAKGRLADTYMSQRENTSAEKIYKEILGTDAKNVGALLGMARLKIRDNDAAGAQEFLGKVEKSGVVVTAYAVEQASAHLIAGETNKACAYLQSVVEKHPAYRAGWQLLAKTAFLAGDDKRLQALVEKASSEKDVPSYIVSSLRGLSAVLQNDLIGGRRYLESSLGSLANQPFIAECILKLDLALGDRDNAAKNARLLLTVDPDNAFANHIMGVLHLSGGRYELAEDSLRKAAESMKAPEILNDLAWILCVRKKYDEAEKYSREALALSPKSHVMWDTLGVILTRRGRLQDAEQAMQKALDLAQDKASPGLMLHMADVQAQLGNKQKAAGLIEAAENVKSQLSAEDQETLERVKRDSRRP